MRLGGAWDPIGHMDLNREPPQWLVDVNPHLNDDHQKFPYSNSIGELGCSAKWLAT